MFIGRLSIVRRCLSTERNKISKIFFDDGVQKMLKDITRFEEETIFLPRTTPKIANPQFMFMSEEQLTRAKNEALDLAKSRTQMPPIMEADTSPPKVLSVDKEIAGYTKYKIMFVDISTGYSNRKRLMSVREPDGTLRFPTHDERTRLNHMFYPGNSKSIDQPKLFEDDNLSRLMKDKEYIHVLDRACNQYEPDDPRYVHVTSTVYKHIDDHGDYALLRSTRHFGPMSLYLAYNKLADGLIIEMISKNFVGDASKLVKIYNKCHNLDYDENEDDLHILKYYSANHSLKADRLELLLQGLQNKLKGKASSLDLEEDATKSEELSKLDLIMKKGQKPRKHATPKNHKDQGGNGDK